MLVTQFMLVFDPSSQKKLLELQKLKHKFANVEALELVCIEEE